MGGETDLRRDREGRPPAPGGGRALTDLPDELHLDALVLQPLVGVLEGEDHPAGDGLPVVEEEVFLLLAFLRLVLHPPPALGVAQHQLQLRALPEPEEAHGTGGARPAGLPAATTDRAPGAGAGDPAMRQG